MGDVVTRVSRRRFLALVAAVAAATGLPETVVAQSLLSPDAAARAAAELTTLAQTLGPGAMVNDLGYRGVTTGPGEAHIVREELAAAMSGREARRTSLLSFVHLTDQHIIDVQSTTRVEFLDRNSNGPCASIPFSSAHRPGEAACARVVDAMNRRTRAIGVSPVTGAPITATISTGDNTDNQQSNECDLFIGLMDGAPVTPQSGDPDRYEGVQSSGNPDYWNPDPAIADRYKTFDGYPDRPGFLEVALAPFTAAGVGVAWYTCYGNHDGLGQGNSPILPGYQEIAASDIKVTGQVPGTNFCSPEEQLSALAGGAVAPAMTVTADPERRYITRAEWIERHLASPGLPRGHGFTDDNLAGELAYYAADVAGVRFVVLDTVNPGGVSTGSIGDIQLAWLATELTRADEEGRLVMVFSHHGLRSLDNPVPTPDPTRDPSFSDLPRHGSDDVRAVLAGHPSLIAWVNGHTHTNVVEVQDEAFWDIGTAAHVDWPAQARLLDVVDNLDGTLSIFTTMIDHEDDEVTSFARELIGNDPQGGFDAGGTGEAIDRNTELLITHPFLVAGGSSNPDAPPTMGADDRGGAIIPATGLPSGLTIGGALALAGAMGTYELRKRAARAGDVNLGSTKRQTPRTT